MEKMNNITYYKKKLRDLRGMNGTLSIPNYASQKEN